MRWLLVAMIVAGCGVTDSADVWTTVVEVHLTPHCTDPYAYPNSCAETIDLFPYCGDELPFLDDQTRDVTAITVSDPDEITGAFQLQYTGALNVPDSERPHVDAVLTNSESEGVLAAYTDYDEPPLYKLDGEGRASEIDMTKLESVSESTLRFVYRDAVEEHTVKPPRRLTIETEDPPPCCSAGRPVDLGVVFALVLLPLRRRRKLRA